MDKDLLARAAGHLGRLLWQWISRSLGALLALLLLFEEWGWQPLQRALARLGQWPPLRRLEQAIARLSPGMAAGVLLVPMLLLVPVKLAAVVLLGRGQALAGLLVIVLAKVLGTALVAHLFALTKPQLLQLGWFARGYARWQRWRQWLLAQIHATWAWRVARVARRQVLRAWAAWRLRWSSR